MSEAFPDIGRMLMVGCGNMGGAMLARWLASGLDPARVTVLRPSGRAVPGGVEVVTATSSAFDTVVLAMKPQQLSIVAATETIAQHDGLLLSILAGVDSGTLAARFPLATPVRAMPNLPVAIGRGVVALHAADNSDNIRSKAQALMRPLGLVEWIDDEASFDLVTALAGSGPGFSYRFIDALAAAGAALGLPADQAARLALATVSGSGQLAAGSDEAPAVLADRVASPGGSTRKGLDVLDHDGALVALLTDTLAAATRRNREMALTARG